MTPELVFFLLGFIVGGIVTGSVMLIVDNLLIPWFAHLRVVRIADRKAARARRQHGSG